MTTPGTMNSLLANLRDKIEDAEEDAVRSERNFNGEQNENYIAGYDCGYAEALKEFWHGITGDKYSAKHLPDSCECDGIGPASVPTDPWQALAYLVGRCGEGFARELVAQGKTETQARNAVVGCFLDFASGEACRIARREGREPDPAKWRNAVDDAFERAVKRTVQPI